MYYKLVFHPEGKYIRSFLIPGLNPNTYQHQHTIATYRTSFKVHNPALHSRWCYLQQKPWPWWEQKPRVADLPIWSVPTTCSSPSFSDRPFHTVVQIGKASLYYRQRRRPAATSLCHCHQNSRRSQSTWEMGHDHCRLAGDHGDCSYVVLAGSWGQISVLFLSFPLYSPLINTNWCLMYSAFQNSWRSKRRLYRSSTAVLVRT